MSELTSHTTTVEGLTLHWTEIGSGDPVLLLHGWPTSAFLYRNVMPHIAAAGRRAIALDLPGFGKSDKPLDASYSFRFYDRHLSGFLDALELEQTGLVVHDLGGPVGLHWMVGNQDRVSALGLLNTIVQTKQSWAVVAFMLALRIPGLRGLTVSPWGLEMAMKIGTHSPGGSAPEVVAGVQAPFVEKDARKALIKSIAGLHPKGFETFAAAMPSLTIPVCMVYGTGDRILPDVPRVFPRLAAELGLPADRVHALDGCGHFLQEDKPDEVGRLLGAFFGETRSGAPIP